MATILQNSLTVCASIDDGHEGGQPIIICSLQKHPVGDLILDIPHSRTHSRASHYSDFADSEENAEKEGISQSFREKEEGRDKPTEVCSNDNGIKSC